MLTYSPWKIEQTRFAPEQEAELERQLAFSNGYISQYAFFEEFYSGSQSSGTWLRGIAGAIPPFSSVSVHLHDERLDLNTWHVQSFSRCLNRQEPLLERSVKAVSPNGRSLNLKVRRLLSTDEPGLMQVRYAVSTDSYEGPASFLSLLGEAKPTTP